MNRVFLIRKSNPATGIKVTWVTLRMGHCADAGQTIRWGEQFRGEGCSALLF
jgi:hypothetical protein